jgi:hypothetical protein
MLRKPVSKRSVTSILLGLLALAALLTSLFFTDTARAQGPPAYVGTFTLRNQIHWSKTVLEPGKYTISLNSTLAPITIATIRTVDGEGVFMVMSQPRSGDNNGVNALLIKEKDGKPTVYSLALADLGLVLIYDPRLARQTVQEARVSQTIPVTWAKK